MWGKEREEWKCDRNATRASERRIVGIVLVQEECSVRPKLGRVEERGGNQEREKEMDDGERGGHFWVECGQPLITSAG